VWRALPGERRLAAGGALALLLTLFLPWYQEAVIVSARTRPLSATFSVTGWGAFSFVEAAVMLVAISVLVLLFQRGEGRAFHLPGGDGLVITLAGGWTCFLVAWRMLDKEGTSGHSQYASSSGIEWGIFVTVAAAGLLTYAGTRIRASNRPEPPLPGEDDAVFDGHWHTVAREPRTPARERGTTITARDQRATTAGEAPTVAAGEQRTAAHGQQTAAPRGEEATVARGERPATSRDEEATVVRGEEATVARGEEPTIARGRTLGGRSSWRPADHPGWSEQDSHLEWLIGTRSAPASPEPVAPPDSAPTESLSPGPAPDEDGEQLTIPLEGEH
jgi:hypothetical protein